MTWQVLYKRLEKAQKLYTCSCESTKSDFWFELRVWKYLMYNKKGYRRKRIEHEAVEINPPPITVDRLLAAYFLSSTSLNSNRKTGFQAVSIEVGFWLTAHLFSEIDEAKLIKISEPCWFRLWSLCSRRDTIKNMRVQVKSIVKTCAQHSKISQLIPYYIVICGWK